MIRANASKMFATIEPCYVSGSRFELGDGAADITWRNALRIADNEDRWLLSDKSEAVEDMRQWARATGAWGDEELSDRDLMGLFAQNIASELRDMGADDVHLEDLADLTSEGAGFYCISECGDLCVEWHPG